MRFLLSNDDGYLAPGLAALHRAIAPLGECVVVAPERNCSGASNSLTLDRSLTRRRAVGGPSDGFYFVDGTPSDCVHLSLTGFLREADFAHSGPVDLVLSGINAGANMGDDTLYSGTVAAATEGYLFQLPAIAVSLVYPPRQSPRHFETAGRVVAELVAHHQANPIRGAMLLNVNVPDTPYAELRGWRVTRLGKRHQAEPVIRAENPQGDPIWWIGAAGPAQDAAEDTDFWAVHHGYVSITPLQVDLTAYRQREFLAEWLEPVRQNAG